MNPLKADAAENGIKNIDPDLDSTCPVKPEDKSNEENLPGSQEVAPSSVFQAREIAIAPDQIGNGESADV